MTDIDRVDHTVVVTITDLDGLARTYERLGFTVSPESRHLANARPGEPKTPLGTANRCVVFADNYVELLGLVEPDGGDQWGVRRLAAAHEGLRGQIFGCLDADAVDRRLTEAGMETSGVLAMERDVQTPQGIAKVRARAVRMDLNGAPEGALGFGEIGDRSMIFQPPFMKHENGAVELSGVLLVVADVELDHYLDRYRTLLDVQEDERRVFQLRLGQLRIAPVSTLDDLLPGQTAPVLPYVAAQTVTVTDLSPARALIEGNGFDVRPLDNGFFVHAFGANIVFQERP
ncbi:VOC family protein [Fodinicola acaciae]|uniref:VOC family protein n=1 Tax=Fodinicola acaciae TaxID=2681555 RepID=UPI0013D1AAC1|nr:VOC family protein [Fodinicola acaciae]